MPLQADCNDVTGPARSSAILFGCSAKKDPAEPMGWRGLIIRMGLHDPTSPYLVYATRCILASAIS